MIRHLRRTPIAALAVLVALSAREVKAFGKDQTGTSGAAFLKIGPGARPAGMGEAFTGVADDVQAIYWNPAGLATLPRPELTAMHMQWFQSIQYEHAAFAYPTETHGTWGMSISDLHTNNLERRTEDTDSPSGQFGASDSAYTLSYGKRITSKLSLGSNLKYVRQVLDTNNASAFAADGGALYDTGWRDLRVGAALQNFGTKVKFSDESDPLPLTFRLGASAPVFVPNFLFSSDLILPRDHQVGLAFGGEYKRKISRDMIFSVRSGYRTDQDVSGLSGIAAGGGLEMGRFSFDFAWVPFGELGNSYRYSMHIKFGPAGEEQPRPDSHRLQKASLPFEPPLNF